MITGITNGYTEKADRDNYDNLFKDALTKAGADWKSFIWYMYDDYPDGAPFYSEKGLNMWPSAVMNQLVVFGPENTLIYTNLLDAGRESLPEAMKYLQNLFKYTPTHYESKTYSQDGKVEKYQSASVGNGIDIVITGDAFSDRLISNGTFKKAATQAVKDLFSVEPYKSMQNRFNIYFVNAVSKNEDYFNGGSTVCWQRSSGRTAIHIIFTGSRAIPTRLHPPSSGLSRSRSVSWRPMWYGGRKGPWIPASTTLIFRLSNCHPPVGNFIHRTSS